MTRLPASSAAEPRHIRGGAGGAGRGQWVRYPLRVVVDAEAYAPVDTNVYGKWRALASGRRATASVDKVAGWLGVSKSTLERSNRRLGAPAPTDDVQELFTKRQTHKVTGTGQTAERWCRDLDRGEAYVCGPVRAADTLRPIAHRLYLGLRHAITVRGHQPTLTELAQLLRHHGGKQAGQPLAEASVSRLLDELAALGWITLDKRAGYRGRHLITVHDDPVRLVDEAAVTPDPDDGSAPDLGDGSLAYKEYLGLNDRGNTPPTAVLGIRRRRPTATSARDERDAAVDTFGRRTGLDLTPAAWRTVHAVLAPVRHELPALTGWEWERAVHEVLRHLRDGQHPTRLHDRLQRRYPQMRAPGTPDDGRPPVRTFARWLIGAALTRHGCPDERCETGVIWTLDPDDHQAGTDCQTCAYAREAADRHKRLLREIEDSERRVAARRAQQRPHTPQEQPTAPEPAPSPPHAPPHAPTGPTGPPPGTGGWRALVARERPQAAVEAYRHRWTGSHADHIRPARDTA
ncbi:hypothetical protein ACKI10_43240 [Streptomyces galilaeus]|uniref:Helix-turn-helix domain-containing protein n=1 Tax=Streptomyces galilaeus TaxID=33899 RepID=A0ABW9IYR1_STRGJ